MFAPRFVGWLTGKEMYVPGGGAVTTSAASAFVCVGPTDIFNGSTRPPGLEGSGERAVPATVLSARNEDRSVDGAFAGLFQTFPETRTLAIEITNRTTLIRPYFGTRPDGLSRPWFLRLSARSLVGQLWKEFVRMPASAPWRPVAGSVSAG